MKILKNILNYSSFDLWHKKVKNSSGDDIFENWTENYQIKIAIGDIYEHCDFGKCKILDISVEQQITVCSFFLFWYSVKPKLKTVVSFQEVRTNGMKHFNQDFNGFVSKFKNVKYFQEELNNQVNEIKTKGQIRE